MRFVCVFGAARVPGRGKVNKQQRDAAKRLWLAVFLSASAPTLCFRAYKMTEMPKSILLLARANKIKAFGCAKH